MAIEFDSTVRGGMPVTVCYEIGSASPSVGILYPWIADLWLEVRGKRAKWLEESMHEQDRSRLYEEALEKFHR